MMDNSDTKVIANDHQMAMDNDNRLKELKSFDDTKAGVKGLVDAGITSLPEMFIWPPEMLAEEIHTGSNDHLQVPVIDLSSKNSTVIDEIRRASEEWGFFQVINHGIPRNVLDGVIDRTRIFHEQDVEVKKQYYSRDSLRKVKYCSNLDLYQSSATGWKDVLAIQLAAPDKISPDDLPELYRSTIIEYTNHVNKLGKTIFELLSEALGLELDNLNTIGCANANTILLFYSPACPEPDKTLASKRHTDRSFITILLQDQIGGLQVMYDNKWTDVTPIKGSLIVNIGDLLQIVSNDKFKSAEHRVITKSTGPRISVASFFNDPFTPGTKYGPLKELVSEESPALYKEFTIKEYQKHFFSRSYDMCSRDIWKM